MNQTGPESRSHPEYGGLIIEHRSSPVLWSAIGIAMVLVAGALLTYGIGTLQHRSAHLSFGACVAVTFVGAVGVVLGVCLPIVTLSRRDTLYERGIVKHRFGREIAAFACEDRGDRELTRAIAESQTPQEALADAA